MAAVAFNACYEEYIIIYVYKVWKKKFCNRFWPVDVIPSLFLNWDDDDDDDDVCIVAESEEGERKDTYPYRMKRRLKQGGRDEARQQRGTVVREDSSSTEKHHWVSNLLPAAQRLPRQNVRACQVGSSSWILIEWGLPVESRRGAGDHPPRCLWGESWGFFSYVLKCQMRLCSRCNNLSVFGM